MYLVSRTDTFARLFFIVSFIGLFVYAIIAFITLRSALKTISLTGRLQKKIQSLPNPGYLPLKNSKDQKPKYILLWTMYDMENPIGEGQTPFVNYDCLHQNCYLTTNKKLLDYTAYDAVVFNVTELKRWNQSHFPPRRSPIQKYVFFGKKSSYDAPVCSQHAENFFNWTWSYKLYSDIFSPFVEVRDLKGNIVAPNTDVIWNNKLIRMPLGRTQAWTAKPKAVVAIIRKCGTAGKESLLTAKRFQDIFKQNKMVFDIIDCRLRQCLSGDCQTMVRRDYYFYFVHEGSLAEDYVTDEVVNAFEAGVVPIVFGAADYSKFLPPSSYINSRSMTPESLVAMVNYAIRNPTVYQGFFRWKSWYTVHRTPPFKGLCQLCSMLYNSVLMGRQSKYDSFRRWWYDKSLDERCMKIETQNASLLQMLRVD